MPTLRRRLADGQRVRLRVARAEAADEAVELAQRLAAAGAQLAALEFDGASAFLKAGPLSGAASRRHALRQLLLRRPAPRLAEFDNLEWLRARHFRALEPLAAGCLERGGLPRFQFLVTRAVEDAPELWTVLADGSEAQTELLEEVAREAARMHALHFVHRDLYPRNLLVAAPVHGRRLVLSDCWAGGPGLGRRGPSYDLACFLLHTVEVCSEDALAGFAATYERERAQQGKPIDAQRFFERVARERTALVRQLEREPGRLRGRALPRADWRVRR